MDTQAAMQFKGDLQKVVTVLEDLQKKIELADKEALLPVGYLDDAVGNLEAFMETLSGLYE